MPYSSELTSKSSKKTIRPFLHALLYAPPPVLLELVQAGADDVATWARLGLFGKTLGGRAERFSDWCWLFATLVGLVENGVERQMIGNLRHEGEPSSFALLFNPHGRVMAISRIADVYRIRDGYYEAV